MDKTYEMYFYCNNEDLDCGSDSYTGSLSGAVEWARTILRNGVHGDNPHAAMLVLDDDEDIIEQYTVMMDYVEDGNGAVSAFSDDDPSCKYYYAGVNPYGIMTKSDCDHVVVFRSSGERDLFVAQSDMEREQLTREEAVCQFGENMVARAEYLADHDMTQGIDALKYVSGMI